MFFSNDFLVHGWISKALRFLSLPWARSSSGSAFIMKQALHTWEPWASLGFLKVQRFSRGLQKQIANKKYLSSTFQALIILTFGGFLMFPHFSPKKSSFVQMWHHLFIDVTLFCHRIASVGVFGGAHPHCGLKALGRLKRLIWSKA